MSANPTPARIDPFANFGDLDDFKPAAAAKPKPEPEAVRQVSEANNFPSRSPTRKPR